MIAEPATTLTDYLLALESAWFSWRLGRLTPPPVLWATVFAGVSLTAALGGTFHGFRHLLPDLWVVGLWETMLLSLGGVSALLLLADVQEVTQGRCRRIWQGAAIAKLILYLWVFAGHRSFGYAAADYLVAMLGVLGLEVRSRRCQSRPGRVWIAFGVLTSLAAVGVLAGLQPFMAADARMGLYHVVQMVAIWGFYRGVWLNYRKSA